MAFLIFFFFLNKISLLWGGGLIWAMLSEYPSYSRIVPAAKGWLAAVERQELLGRKVGVGEQFLVPWGT